MDDGTEPVGPLWKRLAWMAAIWLGSVAALFLVASLIKYGWKAASVGLG